MAPAFPAPAPLSNRARVASQWLRTAAHPDGLALTTLALLPLLLFHRVVFGGRALAGWDLVNYFFPLKTYAARLVWQGELPLWNPDYFLGVPLLANIQNALLYPPDFLFYVLPFAWAVDASTVLHVAIAGVGMYSLARWGWGLGPFAGWCAGAVFAGSGYIAAHIGHLNQVHAAVWLPTIALAALCAARGTRRVRWLAAGSVFLALQVLAGHAQEVYYGLLALCLYAGAMDLSGRAATEDWRVLAHPHWPSRTSDNQSSVHRRALAWVDVRFPHLTSLLAISVGGAGLAAVQLLPAFELSGQSYRSGGIPFDEATSWAVDRTAIFDSLLPNFWAVPSQEVVGYTGVVSLVLALLALARPASRRHTLLLTGLAVLAVALSLGSYTPLYWWLHDHLPGFSSFRAPGRWMFIYTFAVAGLAAHGAQCLVDRQPADERERRVRGFGLALLAAGAALGVFYIRSYLVHAIHRLPNEKIVAIWLVVLLAAAGLCLVGITTGLGRRASLPRLLLAALLAGELFAAGWPMEYNRPVPPEVYAEVPAVAGRAAVAASAEPQARVLSIAREDHLDVERMGRGTPFPEDREYLHYVRMREVLKPNLPLAYGLSTLDGYDGGLLPTREYAAMKELLLPRERAVPHLTIAAQARDWADSRLLGALNVAAILADADANPGPGAWQAETFAGLTRLYRNPDLLPRAYVVPGYEVVDSSLRTRVAALRTADLRRVAVLEKRPAGLASSGTGAGAKGGDVVAARIVRYSPRQVELVAHVPYPSGGLVVLSDAAFPGWHATVDGRPAEVLRANVLLRAVALPAGEHRVRFTYQPWTFWAGVAVTLLAAAGLIALWRRG